MTKREWEDRRRVDDQLLALGFTRDECAQLRRISHTLRRWFEMECGTGDGQVMRSIERDGDEDDSTPYLRMQYPTAAGYVDRRVKIADRERGARRRLVAIVAAVNARACKNGEDTPSCPCHPLTTYIQTDPRGAALYLMRPGDVPDGGDVSSFYTRGICVY